MDVVVEAVVDVAEEVAVGSVVAAVGLAEVVEEAVAVSDLLQPIRQR